MFVQALLTVSLHICDTTACNALVVLQLPLKVTDSGMSSLQLLNEDVAVVGRYASQRDSRSVGKDPPFEEAEDTIAVPAELGGEGESCKRGAQGIDI